MNHIQSTQPLPPSPPRRTRPIARIIGVVVLAVAVVLLWGYQRVPTMAAAGSELNAPSPSVPVVSNPPHRLRVGTFNIAGGVGTDHKFDLSRTLAEMKDCDLVALQEVHGRTLLESRDQAHILGEQLQQSWLFAPAERQWWHDSFGNGVLTRLPCTHWERLPITGDSASNHRSLLRLDVRLGPGTVHVLIVHLPTTNDRPSQQAIVRSLFLDLAEPVVLLGDLNTKPGDPWIESLRHEQGVVDGVGQFAEHDQPQHVDWIFARGLTCTAGGAIDHGASDHPFYWNEFEVAQR